MLALPTWLILALLHLTPIALAAYDIPLNHNVSPLQALAKRGDEDALAEWAREAGLQLRSKYGILEPADVEYLEKRQGFRSRGKRQAATTSSVPLMNNFADASYVAGVKVGTPAQSFNMIMDTGSSDFWVADVACTAANGCPTAISRYDPAQSSTFTNGTSSFSITYGSGLAAGYLGKDSVSLGRYVVTGQVFGVCDNVQHILRDGVDVSGIMGLGWAPIASSKAIPAWQTLADGGVLQDTMFSFALKRLINTPSPPSSAPGGTLTIGGTNPSLFQGNINYIPLSATPSYWLIPLENLNVNGNSVDISGNPNVAIDTGTSLIGCPRAALDNIFAQVPGAQKLTSGAYTGYYTIPCGSDPKLALQFGGMLYSINAADMNLGQANGGCLTSFFEISPTSGKNIPQWIIGAAFLKNVYTVFRGSPPSVGFAQLAANFQDSSSVPQLAAANAAPDSSSNGSGSKKSSSVMGQMKLGQQEVVMGLACIVLASAFVI